MAQPVQHAFAILGGGCFWCLEAVFERMRGVISVVSGYAGGAVAAPSYEQICDGNTGHAEVVRIEFDPAQITYRDLLEVFFAIHDPTTRDRQGNDVGTQYRSVIFWGDEAQRVCAQGLLDELTSEKVFSAPLVTELLPAPVFWPAEAYHQGYFRGHAQQPYCAFVVAPKLAKFRQKFAQWIKEESDGRG